MRRTRLPATAAVAVAAFVGLGLPDGILGVAWPTLRVDVDQPVGALGAVVVASTAGYLVSTVANGPLMARMGTGRHLLTGVLLSATGLAAIAIAPVFAVTLAGASLLGFGGGAVDAGLNSHVALLGGARLMNLLHAAYGIGTSLGPPLAAAAVAAASWRAAYGVAVAVEVAIAAAVVATLPRWRSPARHADGHGHVPAGPGRHLLEGLLLVLFFVYTGVEVATGAWAFTLLTDGRGMGDGAAAAWVTAYWAALTVGRILAGVVGGRIRPERLLDLSIAGSALGAGLLWLDPGGAGALGLPVMGVSLAAVFPTLVLLTPGRLGRARAAGAIGRQLAAGSLGAAGLAAAVGLVVDAAGVDAIAAAVAAGAVVLVAAHVATARFAASHASA